MFQRLQRGGWPYSQPPNVPFELNTDSPQAEGLVAWWPTLASAGAGVLRDLSGYGNDAPFPGGAANPTWTVSPEIGSVLEFDGADFVETGVTRVGDTGLFCDAGEQFTVVVWHRPVGQGKTILARAGGVAGNRTFHLYSSWGSVSTVLRGGAADLWAIATPAGILYCIAVTWDGSTAIGYVNGVAESAGLVVGAAVEEGAEEIVLGDRTSNGAADFALTAGSQLGETSVYDRALSPALIWQMAHDARWELYRPLTRRVWVLAPVVGNIKQIATIDWANVKAVGTVAEASIKAIATITAN